jgi:hypothetical protein
MRMAAACLLDKKDPRRMIPLAVALGHEAIDLASKEFDQRQGARWRASRTRRAAISGLVVQALSRASASVVVVRTSRRRVLLCSRGQDASQEPPPRVAHQQRRTAGDVTI